MYHAYHAMFRFFGDSYLPLECFSTIAVKCGGTFPRLTSFTGALTVIPSSRQPFTSGSPAMGVSSSWGISSLGALWGKIPIEKLDDDWGDPP